MDSTRRKTGFEMDNGGMLPGDEIACIEKKAECDACPVIEEKYGLSMMKGCVL